MKNARPPLDLARLTAGAGSLLTTLDVAHLLRVHPKHVYRLLRRGLPGHRVGGEWRFNVEEVLSWSGARSSPAGASRGVGKPGRGASSSTGSLPPLLAANGDVAVEYLIARMAKEDTPSLGMLPADRGTGLELLRRGDVLAAGCHGLDIPGTLDRQKLVFIHLVDRQVGLGLRRGVKMRSLRHLGRWRVASRPETAGVRAHFDHELRQSGVDPQALHENAAVLQSHCEVVCAVARGEADVGLASQAWAHKVGLTFVPLCQETYGLLVHASALGDPRIVRLCEVAQSAAFRRDIGNVPGYDARHAGTIRYEPPARHHTAAPAS